MKTRIFIYFSFLLLSVSVHATICMPSIFADSMALQQQSSVSVWGQAEPNSRVVVRPDWGKAVITQADDEGYFKVSLSTPAYKDMPEGQLCIQSGRDKIYIRHILFAEVWLAAGQSNMEMRLLGGKVMPVYGAIEAIAHSAEGYPIRFYKIPHQTASVPQWKGEGQWFPLNPATAGGVSACAYSFAKEISRTMQTPVAIVQCCWSGTKVEPWMTPEAIRAAGDEPEELPAEPTRHQSCAIYNGQVHPIEGFGIRGMIWYQGESNTHKRQAHYKDLFVAFINGLRKVWGCGTWPVYFAQLAPYYYTDGSDCATVRQAQALAVKELENCAMAVLLDVGDSVTIHPPYKKEVGERLAYLALNKTYGLRHLPCESPTYQSMEIKEGYLIINFNHAPLGIMIYGPVRDLEVAGADGNYHSAQAQWTKEGLKVWSDEVPEPKAVRYGWCNYTKGALFSPFGLPVAPFRSEDPAQAEQTIQENVKTQLWEL